MGIPKREGTAKLQIPPEVGGGILLTSYQTFNMIYPSAKTNHWHRLITHTSEFWKIKLKKLRISQMKLRKTKKIRPCDFNYVNDSWNMLYLYWYKCSCIECLLQLYLCHDFYNITFKIKHKLYIASVSRYPHHNENLLGCFQYYCET